jgi:hypothetical protein
VDFPHHAAFSAKAHGIRFDIRHERLFKSKPLDIISRANLFFCFIQEFFHQLGGADVSLFERKFIERRG